jgi:hypothetical protein
MTTTPTLRGLGSLQLGGQEYPFSVGVNQADIFSNLDSQKQDGKALTLPAYYELFADTARLLGGPYRDFIYSALLAGAERAGIGLSLSRLDIGELMDDPATDPAELAKPLNEMLAQLTAKAQAEAERQKKAQGKTVAPPAPTPDPA